MLDTCLDIIMTTINTDTTATALILHSLNAIVIPTVHAVAILGHWE